MEKIIDLKVPDANQDKGLRPRWEIERIEHYVEFLHAIDLDFTATQQAMYRVYEKAKADGLDVKTFELMMLALNDHLLRRKAFEAGEIGSGGEDTQF
jgi:hypothetical protein